MDVYFLQKAWAPLAIINRQEIESEIGKSDKSKTESQKKAKLISEFFASRAFLVTFFSEKKVTRIPFLITFFRKKSSQKQMRQTGFPACLTS
jgi:hypothetical protein